MGEKELVLHPRAGRKILNQRYQDLMEIIERTSILRKRISWATIRLACIPLKVKGTCAYAENKKSPLSHYRSKHVDSQDKRGL